jgi:hypothetical protein
MDLRITPGSEINIKELAETFDDVFFSEGKVVEIGLSSMELLSAADLKLLLARQFAYYAENNNPPSAFIKRAKNRFESMGDNIHQGGFLLMLNPIAWLCFKANYIIDSITFYYQVMAEFRADQMIAHYSGPMRLSHALAQYGVKTEMYRELIDIVNNRVPGKPAVLESNIYDSMRSAQFETTDELKTMIAHLFKDSDLARGDIGKKTLKLRLRRLPETPEMPNPEFRKPAVAYLKDWRVTENRMMKLLQG